MYFVRLGVLVSLWFKSNWRQYPVVPSQIQKNKNRIFTKKNYSMSLLNQQKGKKKNDKKKNQNSSAPGSKFIQKPQANTFVSKQANTGSQRGS